MTYSPTLPFLVMKSLPPLNAQLVLKSISPGENRFRIYQVAIISTVIKQPVYIVTLSWGRIGSKRQRKSYVCQNQKQLDTILKPTLRTRHHHKYQLAFLSPDFPDYEILNEFSSYKDHNRQLQLF